jgi:WD40 repeat protein/serine/threonine protein kinase
MLANAVIDELVEKWERARARGEEPSAQELCRAHPELIEPVTRRIAERRADLLSSTAASALNSAPGSAASPPTEASVTSTLPKALDWCDGLRPPQEPGELGRLGPFRVIKLLGSGGMGTVYQAIDTQLGRSVALKVMPARPTDCERAQARFLREARTAAALEHDNVVAIFQVGEDNGVSYLAMPLLHGQTLAERLKQSPRLAEAECLRIGREIAEGLAAAHARGLIHRDVKPGNIWLEEGTGRVKILDFGLARVAGETSRLTQDGAVVGTPAYMAPEQARGCSEVDYRSDLFSLGCILYRLITGHAAFPADNEAAMLMAIAWSDPIAPSQIDPAVSPGLERLILRLLAKDPAARPQSARAVVDEIRALEVAGTTAASAAWPDAEQQKPNSAPRPTTPSGSQRRRFAAFTAAVTVICVLTLAPVFALLKPPDHAAAGPRERTGKRSGSRFHVPAAVVGSQRAPVQASGAGARSSLPEPAPHEPAQVAVVVWPKPPAFGSRLPGVIAAPASLAGVGRWQVQTRAPRDAVLSLSWSPDRRRLACAAGETVVRLYDADRLELTALLVGHTRPVFCVSWSPDGTRLATGSGDGTVRLWNADGSPGPILRGHAGSVVGVSWSSDGSRLASASYDRTVRIWRLDGTPPAILAHPAQVTAVVWRPDSSQLASAGAEEVLLWNADGTPKAVLKGHTRVVHSVTWSPDGATIASASDDGTVRLWVADGSAGHVLDDNNVRQVRAVAWSPDGMRLASAGTDSKVRVWHADGTPGPVLQGLARTLDSVCWSPDGKSVAAGNSAGEIRIWDVNGVAGPHLKSLDIVSAVAFRGDGERVVTASTARRALLVWGPEEGPARVLQSPARVVTVLAWSPDGARIAADGPNSTVQLLSALASPGPAIVLKGHEARINGVAWSPDGAHVATASSDGTARIWGADGTPGPVLKGHGQAVLAAGWSPDGARLATVGDDSMIRFWLADGTSVDPSLRVSPPAAALVWSPDGKRLAVGTQSGSVEFRAADGTPGPSVSLKTGTASAVAWHPDSTRLATASAPALVRIWDQRGREGPPLAAPLASGDWRDAGLGAAWSTDGSRLLAASRHGFFWAWNTRTLELQWSAIQTSVVDVAVFSPEGRTLKSTPAALDQLIYLIERPDGGVDLLNHRAFAARTAGRF